MKNSKDLIIKKNRLNSLKYILSIIKHREEFFPEQTYNDLLMLFKDVAGFGPAHIRYYKTFYFLKDELSSLSLIEMIPVVKSHIDEIYL